VSRIDEIFAALRADGRKALMPFICGGHPTPDATPGLLRAAAEGGASIIEVGFPYSDPIADGPVIASAMHTAIEAGATQGKVFDAVRSVRDELSVGLIAMVSVSIVERLGGAATFVQRAKDAGFDGFIFPDAPLEESDGLLKAAGAAGLTVSLLVAPTTPPERAAEIAKACTGFVYLIARSGITGERSDAPEIAGRVGRLRESTDLPIACGFGISSSDQVRAVVRHADAAIVGSALVRAVAAAADPALATRDLVRELASGLN